MDIYGLSSSKVIETDTTTFVLGERACVEVIFLDNHYK